MSIQPQLSTTQPNDSQDNPQWMDDLHDMGFDELRELPNHLQLSVDLAILD